MESLFIGTDYMLRWKLFNTALLFSLLPGLSESSQSIRQDALYCEDLRSEMMPQAMRGWKEDFSTALTLAKEQRKPILLAFVGRAWCPWSQKVCAEILSQELFLSAFADKCLLVEMDIQEALQQEAVQIKERYGIEQCPTVLLLSPEGEEISRVDLTALSLSEYISCVEALFKEFQEVDKVLSAHALEALSKAELEALYTKVKALGCKVYGKELLEEGLAREEGSFFLLEKYASLLARHRLKNKEVQELRAKIMKKDPDNAEGGQRALALLEFQALTSRERKKHHPAEAVIPLLHYVERFGKKDPEHLWRMEMIIAQYLFSQDLTALALEHAKASYREAPESSKAEVASALDYLQKHVQRPPTD